MKFRKIVSGLLACTLVATTVFSGDVATVKAEGETAPVEKSYDFNDGQLSADFAVIGAGNAASEAVPVFETGRSGEEADKAVKLGDYALKLAGDVGTSYTVSAWLKPNVEKLGNNASVFLLGAADPEDWIGFAGQGTEGKAKLWSRSVTQDYSHTDFVRDLDMVKDEWTMLTLTQEGNSLSIYQNGVLKATRDNVPTVVSGEGNNILFGATYWPADGVFDGWMDDVKVYNRKLSEEEVGALYRDEPKPIGDYNFNDRTLGEGVSMIESKKNALDAYTGEAEYVQGRTGEEGDSAIKTGKYGLDLGHRNLGSEYSISMWVKPDGTIATNTNVLFIGNHNPEQWVGISGESNSQKCKVWTNNGGDIKWVTVQSVEFPADTWTMVTLAQSGGTLDVYIDGKLAGSGTAVVPMEGENQELYLAASYWDPSFQGSFDDVKVYNKKLTAEQVAGIYEREGSTAAKLFEEGDITVEQDISMMLGASRTISVGLPQKITEDQVDITFTLSDADGVLEFDEATRSLTAKKEGNAQITTTVQLKGTELVKSKTTDVTVRSGNENNIALDYDFSKAVDAGENKVIADRSGNHNDAVIHNPDFVSFSTDSDGQGIMEIKKPEAEGEDEEAPEIPYLDLPMSVMDSLVDQEAFTIETKYARSKEAGGTSWVFCFGSIPKSTGTNYMFYCPNFGFGGNEVRAGIKNSTEEKLFTTGRVLNDEEFYTVSLVFDHGNIKLYLDGVPIGDEEGLDSGYSIMEDVIKDGCQDNILGFVGKSTWAQDTNFVGKLSSFKIYDKALSAQEIQEAFTAVFSEKFAQELADREKEILGSKNASKDEVKYNLNLLDAYGEVPITWTSENENVITAAGKVLNPETATTVKLTAEAKSGNLIGKAELTFKVLPADKTALNEQIARANEALADPFISEASKAAIQKELDKVAAAKGQSEIDTLVNSIKRAVDKKTQADWYLNPFKELAATFNPSKVSITLKPNTTASVVANAVPAKVKDAFEAIGYRSVNSSIATVDATGKVTAKKIGKTQIITTLKAKADGSSKEYKTDIVVVSLSGVKVSAKATSLAKGKTTTMSVTIPKDVKNLVKTTVGYKATGAVSVSKTGKVTAKKAGTGKVTVTVSGAGQKYTKTVTIKVGELTGKSSVKVKKSITLKVKGISGKVKWSLDKKGKKLATISKKGKLTAKKKTGKVKVTAKVGKVTMTKTIKITKK